MNPEYQLPGLVPDVGIDQQLRYRLLALSRLALLQQETIDKLQKTILDLQARVTALEAP